MSISGASFSVSEKPQTRALALQAALLWLAMVVSLYVKIEPAPFDLLMIGLMGVSFVFGGRVNFVLIVPMILLILYNIGGLLSFMQIFTIPEARIFVGVSIYMSMMAILVAILVSNNPMLMMANLRNGWIIAGSIAALMGLVGYFNIGGLGDGFTRYGRATGAFKDPNVYSTYIIPPIVFFVTGFLTGKQKWPFISLISLGMLAIALLLSFSRGAWINTITACSLAAMLLFVLNNDKKIRLRIVILCTGGAIAAVLMIIGLLNAPAVRTLLLQRASLVQDYDGGEIGRFGNQINSIPVLLERPLGFGPLQFGKYYDMDPHNVFLNAFSTYGWLGGVIYPLIILTTVIVGWRAMMSPTPFRNYAIAVWCPFLSTAIQGIQIDTDHWRHFYLLLGMCWGLYGATVSYNRQIRMSHSRVNFMEAAVLPTEPRDRLQVPA